MTNTMPERFEEEAKSWVKSQQGDCMCLGDCQKCNFHRCHGCLCSFIPFIQSEKDLSKKEGQEEYKQFILNILDGIDIADGECNTKAIRLAINSRVI